MAESLDTSLLAPVPHRQFGSTIPKRLRVYCLYRRLLLGAIAAVAASTRVAAIRALTGGTSRWVLLWNLALDEQHGPHLGGCSDCRGVVTINSVTGDVTRNEEYYALAHASRFVRPGARRIASTSGIEGLESVAFRNVDDGSKVLLVVNVAGAQRPMVVRSGDRSFPFVLPAGGVVTFRWK